MPAKKQKGIRFPALSARRIFLSFSLLLADYQGYIVMEESNNQIELFNAKFSSERSNRKKIIEAIINNISKDSIALNIKDNELYLIIDEAVTNAMEHGNQWDSKKNLNVIITKNDSLSITIKDQGAGFDYDLNIKKERKKPGGRGIQIIKHYCSPEWNEQGNQINLVIPIL